MPCLAVRMCKVQRMPRMVLLKVHTKFRNNITAKEARAAEHCRNLTSHSTTARRSTGSKAVATNINQVCDAAHYSPLKPCSVVARNSRVARTFGWRRTRRAWTSVICDFKRQRRTVTPANEQE